MNRIYSIQTKLIIFFLLISIIPVSVTGYVAFENGRIALEEKTFDHLFSIAILKENEINDWINDHVYDLEFFKKLTEKNIVLMFDYLKKNDTRHKDEHSTIEIIFDNILAGKSSFYEFFILDADTGEIHISTDEKQVDEIKINRPYFEEGKKGTYIQPIYYSITTNEPAMTISTPVKDESDNVVAVLAGRVNVGKISTIMMERTGLGVTGETYIVNKFNLLMSSSRFIDDAEYNMEIYTEGVNFCLQHNNGYGLYDGYRGVPVFGCFRWMSELEFCIMAEMDQSEAFASIIGFRNMIISTIFGIGLIVTFLGIFVSQSFSNPIKRLTDKMRTVGTGNFDLENGFKVRESKDEIGELAKSFQKMTHDLQNVTVSRDELNKEIIERKKADMKIIEQNTKLKKLDTLKSAFLNVTSHELRTPMTAMKGYLQMLMGNKFGKISDEQQNALNVILRNTNRLDNLVQDILDTSRLESGTMKFINEKVDVKHLLSEVVETMLPSADIKGITINSDINDEIPMVKIDPQRIKQVIINLINNAIKFSPDDSVINVKAKQDKNDVLFEVEDFGRGIPRDKKERVFETFYQVDSGDNTKFGGAGLGLAITRGIVMSHGGRIWVESEEGKGSTFRFTLPIKSVQDMENRFKEIDVFLQS